MVINEVLSLKEFRLFNTVVRCELKLGAFELAQSKYNKILLLNMYEGTYFQTINNFRTQLDIYVSKKEGLSMIATLGRREHVLDVSLRLPIFKIILIEW